MLSATARRTLSIIAQKLPSNWAPHRLQGGTSYPFNVAHCLHPEPHWLSLFEPPLATVAYHCNNPRSTIAEFVIARHKNPHHGFKQNDIVSLVAIIRTGVQLKFDQQIRQHIRQHQLAAYDITHAFTDDHRPRTGITTTCLDPNELNKLRLFINFVDSVTPIDPPMRQEIEHFLNPDFNIDNLPARLQTVSDLKPAYFQYHKHRLHFGGVQHRYCDEEDRNIIDHLPEIHQAILLNDKEKIIQLLKENPSLVNQKNPWGTEAHDVATDFSHEYLGALIKAREQVGFYSSYDKRRQDNYYNIHADIQEKLQQQPPSTTEPPSSSYLPRNHLHQACIDGDTECVIEHLNTHPQHVDQLDPQGLTPLLLALSNGHFDLARWLMRNGASPEKAKTYGEYINVKHLQLAERYATEGSLHELQHQNPLKSSYINRYVAHHKVIPPYIVNLMLFSLVKGQFDVTLWLLDQLDIAIQAYRAHQSCPFNPVFWALSQGQHKIAAWLIELGASLEQAKTYIPQYAPKRSALHQACIDGDHEAVNAYLKKNSQRIEEQDPRGFTPLLLAVANGHFELSKYLIKQGASLATVKAPNHLGGSINLIENAKTPEIIELLLHHGLDPHLWQHERMIEAILKHDVKMVKHLLYYFIELPQHHGLTALELALRLSENNGPEIVKLLLAHHNDFVPDGPYDVALRETMLKEYTTEHHAMGFGSPFMHNITPEVARLLEQHNLNMQKQIAKNNKRIKYQPGDTQLDLENSALIEIFSHGTLTIKSIIKPLSQLGDERKEIERLFFSNFEMAGGADELAFKKHLHNFELVDQDDAPKYINLFYHGDTLVSFVTFKLLTSKDPDTGKDFDLFFAILAATAPSPRYQGQGFSRLTCRIPLALHLKQPDKPLYFFMESLPPGYGLCVLPQLACFYPKHTLSAGLTQHIATLTQVTIRGKTVNEPIQVKAALMPPRDTIENNPVLEYFDHIIHKTNEAMAVIFKYGEDTQALFLKDFQYYGVTARELHNTAAYFQRLQNPETVLKLKPPL